MSSALLTYTEARARDDEEHEARIGRTFAHWRVEASAVRENGLRAYGCECTSCGNLETLSTAELLSAPVCLGLNDDDQPCLAGAPAELDEHHALVLARLAAVPQLDPDLPWERDAECRAWMAEHDESTLEEVGRAIGVSRERVRQIEEAALRKMRHGLEALDVGPEDLALILSRRSRAMASAVEEAAELGL